MGKMKEDIGSDRWRMRLKCLIEECKRHNDPDVFPDLKSCKTIEYLRTRIDTVELNP